MLLTEAEAAVWGRWEVEEGGGGVGRHKRGEWLPNCCLRSGFCRTLHRVTSHDC